MLNLVQSSNSTKIAETVTILVSAPVEPFFKYFMMGFWFAWATIFVYLGALGIIKRIKGKNVI